MAERTGLPLRLLKTKSWTESLEASRTGRCQLISLLNQTPEREAWLIFTQPILTDDNILITREDHPIVVDLDSLQGQTMVLPKGTSIEERVRREFPQLKIIVTDSEAQALQMVSDRKANMTMRSLIVAAYTIKREGWFNLKIAGHEVRTPLAAIDASTQVLMLRLKADTDKLPLVQRIHRGATTRVA